MTTAPVQVNFRMPAELKDKLEAAAKDAGRSTTAEIVLRLEDSFSEISPGTVYKALARLEFMLARAHKQLRMKTLEASLLTTPASAGLPLLKDQLSAETLATMQLAIDSAREDRLELDKDDVLSDEELERRYTASEANLAKVLRDEMEKALKS